MSFASPMPFYCIVLDVLYEIRLMFSHTSWTFEGAHLRTRWREKAAQRSTITNGYYVILQSNHKSFNATYRCFENHFEVFHCWSTVKCAVKHMKSLDFIVVVIVVVVSIIVGCCWFGEAQSATLTVVVRSSQFQIRHFIVWKSCDEICFRKRKGEIGNWRRWECERIQKKSRFS